MAGIAGVAQAGRQEEVIQMVEKISHRGNDRAKLLENRDVTMQAAWTDLRPKAKFWQGAGVKELLAEHAEKTISDQDFKRERRLLNGWVLNTKEELMYYRIFKEHFGELEQLDWMGRTKGSSVH